MQSLKTPEEVHEAPFRYVLANHINLSPVKGSITWTSQTTFEPEVPNVDFRVSAVIRSDRNEQWTQYERQIPLAEARELVRLQSHLRTVCAALGVTELCILIENE